MWRHLRHPNIVPFLGTNRELLGLCTISPWMARDNLKKYLFVMGQKADRPKLVLEIALGLSYLHTRNVTHGDLKSLNVLIDVEHHALLADFGMASVRYNVNSVRQTAPGNGVPRGSVRWMAPELLDPMLGELGKQTWQRLITPIIDVYAFAMVVYEV
ncbi:hypothetical protein IEO21_04707 [Rhodonia placenta]|uniref:Protein kinase domain-containing protein n=1 Tax=Rhodonia placenta TaxID=104341 RepID=A0A8H7P3D3_9APHY|nr:hypothetical protein IEO21_04707 [Postia placenta]